MTTPLMAVLLIAHGSRQPDANEDLLFLRDQLRRSETYPIVEAAFLELAEPSIASAGEACAAQGATEVILLPYFLSAGIHVRRDLTAACQQLGDRFPRVTFRLAEPLGRHPLLVQIVQDRAAQAASAREK